MTTHWTVYHVGPNADAEAWLITQENGGYRDCFRTKQRAIQHAKELAREQEPSQVKIHRADGRVESESTYGADGAASIG